MKTYYQISDALPAQIAVGGWMEDFLRKEVSGMPGNLHRIGYPFNKACWRSRSMTEGGYAQWWPYEQSAYWIDSMVRAAAVLKDDAALETVLGQIEASLTEDGESFIGPIELKGGGSRSRWPHAVYFRALWELFLYTGNEKYIRRMREHYLSDKEDYGYGREIANAETMYRIAAYYDDPALKKKADHAMACFTRRGSDTAPDKSLSDFLPHIHGVSVNEDSKMGAAAYLYTGKRKYLEASVSAYEKLHSFHTLPDGVHSCYEATNGNESYKVHESCDITDYTYGLALLLKATGDGKYADRIERAILNALPGATGTDFRTIQYFSCVNQTIAARNSSHIRKWENTPRMAYQPHHYPECCVGNIGRAMPNYCLNLYGDTQTGLAVSFYGESTFEGTNIAVKTETAYPFEETVRMTVTRADGKKNLLALRIPGWSRGYTLRQNGKARHCDTVNGYIRLRVHTGDRLELGLHFALTPMHSSDGGIYYSFGPLLMALKLRETREPDLVEKRQTREFPAYNITTDEPFHYALSGFEGHRAKIEWHTVGTSPFWDGSYPIEIRLPARRFDGWENVTRQNERELVDRSDGAPADPVGGEGIDQKQLDCGATRVSGELCLTPRLPAQQYVQEHLGEECEITLVPYGCTRLRVSVFPKYELVQD